MPQQQQKPLRLPVRVLLGIVRAVGKVFMVFFAAVSAGSGDPKANLPVLPPGGQGRPPKEYRP